MTKIRIRSTDVLGNVAFIYRLDNGKWRCTLANGIPASFSYAGVKFNLEQECKFALEDAVTPDEVMEEVKKRSYGGYRYEFV